jgi:hypothetical protein
MENMKMRQLRLNVEEIIDEYVNGMYDDNYPEMTIEECREYVKSQVYDRKAYGNGFTGFREGVCDDLRFLGTECINSVIDQYARESGIIRE